MNTAVSAAVQAVRGRGRGTLTRGAFVGAAAAPGYIAPGTVPPVESASFFGPKRNGVSLFSRIIHGLWEDNMGVGWVCTEIERRIYRKSWVFSRNLPSD